MLGILFVCQTSASDLKVDNPYPTDALLKKEDCASMVGVTAEVDIWSGSIRCARVVVLQHTVLKRFKNILLARHLAYEGLGDASYLYSLSKAKSMQISMQISAPAGFV